MKAVFPGKPQAKLYAVDTARWEGRRLVTYISGNAIVILGGPHDLLQTISHGEEEALHAVAINDISGKIAACTGDQVYVYKPFGQDVGVLRWSLQHTLVAISSDQSISCLSWGVSEELLVGGVYLTLFSTQDPSREVWSRKLANRTKFASLCPDGSLVATSGRHDRLVKIWKRLWFGQDSERFDVSYLPHPAAVTGVRWRGRPDSDYHVEAVLYTTCADNKLRIWAHTDPHGLQTLQLWADIDLVDCMPRDLSPSPQAVRRYVFIIDNWEFEALVERASQLEECKECDKGARKRLMDIAYRDPDVCVILDDRGNMSAWGLERVGCKARQPKDLFSIAQLQGLNIRFQHEVDPAEDFLTCSMFGGHYTDCDINLLFNFFDGRIEWLKCPTDRLFDPTYQGDRFAVDAIWTGHSEPVTKIITAADQATVVTASWDGEVVSWAQSNDHSAGSLIRRSIAKITDPVLQILMVHGGAFAVLLHQDFISLWDLQKYRISELARREYQCAGKTFPLMLLPNPGVEDDICFYVALVTTAMKGVVWRLALSEDSKSHSLQEFTTFKVDGAEPSTFHFFEPSESCYGQSSDSVSVSSSGKTTTWTMTLDHEDRKVHWMRKAEVETHMSDPSVTGISANHKLALVDAAGTSLTIWDTVDGQSEFVEQFEAHDNVLMLDWTTTITECAILAIGMSHKVFIYAQCRYNYLDRQPAWTRFHEIKISEFTNLHIADCSWIGHGDMLVAAGNQMFLSGKDIMLPRRAADDLGLTPTNSARYDLCVLVAALNSVLPVYHPGFLLQSIAIGRVGVVHQILKALHKALKFYTSGEDLDSFLGMPLSYEGSKDSVITIVQQTEFLPSSSSDDDEDTLVITEDIAMSLLEKLSEVALPHLSNRDQSHLTDLAETIGVVERHQRSVDDFGIRYLVLFQQHLLQLKHADPMDGPLPWRDFVWAFRSNSQDILVDFSSTRYNSRMLWEHARECGMFVWITDLTALRAQFEVIARNEYTKTDERNPVDCSLYYLALKKKPVLLGLWRMASWNREQAATQRLLSNNFADPRWKTSALKNAYALLGRRRFEYAAAFFLLADHLGDAVNVLSTQLNDLQLAIAVARVYEGDDGPVLRQLLQDRVLPFAARQGNRWMAHWAFSMLQKHDLALKCLVAPLPSLIDLSPKEQFSQESRHFTTEEPALAALYAHLRDDPEHLKLRRGTEIGIGPEEEWAFVLRCARLYARAGCEVLALDLVRNWRFRPREPSRPPTNGDSPGRDVSAAEDDGTMEVGVVGGEESDRWGGGHGSAVLSSESTEANGEVKRKKVVEEPSAASIFDNFDF